MAKAKRVADYNGIFAVRLRVCMDDQGITQKELADYIGKTRQAVNFYTLGETVPDADTLILISRRLNVSVDYLLGLTDAAALNTSIQDIHHITGLSEKAIDQLIFMNNPVYNSSSELLQKGLYEKEWLKTINFLIETTITIDKSKKGYFNNGFIADLSDYYTVYSQMNEQEIFVLSTGKVFTDLNEAKEEAYQESARNPEKKTTIGCVKTNEMLENMWMDRLTVRIRESKDDFYKYVGGLKNEELTATENK